MAQVNFEELLPTQNELENQDTPPAPGAEFSQFLAPGSETTDTREELEKGLLMTVLGGLDYVGGKNRGLIRGMFGGDFSDTAPFSRDTTDPGHALGFLAPGGGIIPEARPTAPTIPGIPAFQPITEFIKHVPSTTLGIALDIFTDPLTFITGGAGKGIQYGLGGVKATIISARQLARARRVAETIAGPVTQTRAAQAIASGARRVYNAADELVISKTTRTDDLGAIARKQRDLDFRKSAMAKEVYQSHMAVLRSQENLISKFGDEATSGDIMSILTDAMEKKPTGPVTFNHPKRADILADTDARAIIDELGPGYRELREFELANDIASPDFGMAREYKIGDLSDKIDEMKSRREGDIMTYFQRIEKESLRTMRYADKEIKRLSGPAFRDLPETNGAITQMNKMKFEARDRMDDIRIRVGERIQNTPSYMQRVEDRIFQQRELQKIDPNYVPHSFTPEAKTAYYKLNRRAFGGFIRRRTFSESHTSQLNRQLLDDGKKYPTAAEFNKAGHEGKVSAFGNKKLDFNIFETDPIRLSIDRQLRGLRTIENTRFLKDVARNYGDTIDDIVEKTGANIDDVRTAIREGEKYGRMTLKDGTMYKQGKAASLGEKWFDPEIADHLDYYNKVSTNPSDMNRWLSVFDGVTNYWKGKTLMLFPAYHSRNVAGNVWNNFLAGVAHPKWYSKADEIQRGAAGNVGDYSYDQIREMIRTNGVENQGWYSADIERSIHTSIADTQSVWDTISDAKLKDWNPFKLDHTDVWSTTGRKAGTYLENNARIANFAHGLQNGLDPDAAAQRVFKYVFDYGDVTKFEKDVLLRIMPFYRWTRFNIPLQAEQLIKQPGKFMAIYHAKEGIEARQGNEPVEEALVSEYISENIGIQWRRYSDEEGRDRASFFLLGNWLPAADLDNLSGLSRFTEEAVAMVNPLLKTPMELLANYDTFRKRPIERIVDPRRDTASFFNPTGGEMGEFLGIPMRQKWEHTIRNVRILYEIDRSNPYNVNNAVPWVREHVFGADLGNRPAIPENQRGAWERWFRFLSGVRLADMDVGTARAIERSMSDNAMTGYRGLLRDNIRDGNKAEENRLRKVIEELNEKRRSIGGTALPEEDEFTPGGVQ